MPVTFELTEPVSTLDGSHIVCFPAISQKTVPDDDPIFMKELYEKHPAVNYYNQHSAAASARGKPGFYNIHTISDAGGVINMFIRLYTGSRSLSNDNLPLRVKYFKACMEQLITCRTLTRLHFYFPVKTPDDLKDYIQALEDFTSTYKLNNSIDLDVIIHHQAPSAQQQIIKKQSTAPEDESFQLLCDDTQISEQSLFEVDFVRYIIKKNTNESDAASQTLSVMKYFPNLSTWNMIRYDAKLNQLAESIPLDKIESDTVYPPSSDIFNAFSYMRGDPKIVLLGQDPYHRKGQAHGLSFSVQHGVAIPPSLRNIYKALTNDIPGFVAVKHGNLTSWAEQGVLMLNSALTVDEGSPGSHLELWEPFTNHMISLLSQKYKGLVFMLWGTKAKAKKALISAAGSHLILECQHPSPQIANNTFEKDCNHFSRANDWLKSHSKTEIDWNL